jgi:hypothetical protein
MATILDEDFATMCRIQRNLATGVVRELAFGRNEVALQHFHHGLHTELERHGFAVSGRGHPSRAQAATHGA